MSGFVLHPAAFADLEEIWEFIAVDSLDAADRVPTEIQDAIRAKLTARSVQSTDGTT
jgi:plasmid stabilization system protein ParE